jgi:hypothetical protein
MAQTLKFGNGTWATKKDSILAYNDENENYKPLPFNYTGAGKGTRVNKEGLIEVVENDRPRIDYLDSEDGVFLLEKAATNLVTYSEDFTQSNWIKTDVTVSSNQTISPDGTLNADLIIANSTTATHKLQTNESGLNQLNPVSVYVKSAGYNNIQIASWANPANYINFNIANGTVTKLGSVAPTIYGIESVGNGWYRVWANVQGSGSGSVGIHMISSDDSVWNESFTGDGVSGLYLWGGQIESGNLSSYIPTQGSIQTRVQETASDSGNSEVFNDSEGVLFADIAALSDDGTSRRISLTDVSGSTFLNLVSIELDESSGILKAFVSDNTNIGILQGNIIQTQYNKIALKYNASSISLYVNGFELDSNNTPNLPNGLKILDFNNGQSNQISEFYGKTKELGYYDTALTDLELETLTSYRTWESMVNELNLNVIYNG